MQIFIVLSAHCGILQKYKTYTIQSVDLDYITATIAYICIPTRYYDIMMIMITSSLDFKKNPAVNVVVLINRHTHT